MAVDARALAADLQEARPQVAGRGEQLVGRGLAVAGELRLEGGAALRVVEVGEATEEAEPGADRERRLLGARQGEVLVQQARAGGPGRRAANPQVRVEG